MQTPSDIVATQVKAERMHLRRHCEAVGRDPSEVEVTSMLREFTPGANADDLLREAEAFAGIGVSALVTTAVGAAPVVWLEEAVLPLMGRLTGIEPVPL
jgi:hypothetical protein